MGKRASLPKFTSNNIPLLVLNWPSMCARILCSKLSFLYKVSHDQRASLSSQIFNSFTAIDVMSNHLSLQFVLNIARENGWMKFWDVALEHGPKGTRSSLSILKLLCMTVFGERRCPADNYLHTVMENSPLCEHFLQNHTNLPPEIIPNFLTNSTISIGTDSEQFLIILPLGLSIVKSFPF